MRYGLPAWLTSDNGTEFAGVFRHQIERFGIVKKFVVCTSTYHPQSNGAAERLVQTLKTLLAAEVAGTMHNWPALLPQVRMEYMQRRHAVTGYSPNDLVFATPVRLPPPVGALNWEAPIAFGSAQASSQADAYLAGREKRAAKLLAAAHDRILKAQRSNADRQATRLATQRRRGKELLEGDLAYLLQPTGLENTVKGPYVVVKVGEASVELRTTYKVQGQQ